MVLTVPHPTLRDLDVPASLPQLPDTALPRRQAPPPLGADHTLAGGHG
jgi:hypothetical protein